MLTVLLVAAAVLVGVPVTVYLSAKMGAFGWLRGCDQYQEFRLQTHKERASDGEKKCG